MNSKSVNATTRHTTRKLLFVTLNGEGAEELKVGDKVGTAVCGDMLGESEGVKETETGDDVGAIVPATGSPTPYNT